MYLSAALLTSSLTHAGLLLLSFVLLLFGAEVFTNGIEWVGHRFGVTKGATGSVLAAVGTALPETMIPVIAISREVLQGDGGAGGDVAVGAILGAPFMLATVAMFLVGATTLLFSDRRMAGKELTFSRDTARRDLSFFIVGYSLAVAAAFLATGLKHAVAFGLVALYVVYVYRTFSGGVAIEADGLDRLHLMAFVRRVPVELPDPDGEREPPTYLIVAQPLFALLFIVGAAHLFVDQIVWLSDDVVGLPVAVMTLLIAPIVTELPEKFNSGIWISEGKDTMALGNITGAMVFQGTLPVTLGILYTSWNLNLQWGTVGFLNGLSALLALAAASMLYLWIRIREKQTPHPFMVGGLLYLLFVGIVVYHALNYDLQIVTGH